MSSIALIGIAVGLAMDAFAVAVAGSIMLGTVTPRHVFRFAFHFGLFQAMMPVIGWLAGTTIQQQIASWDHWIAFGLLFSVGAKGIYGAVQPAEKYSGNNDPTRGWSLVMLSVATSIDALAVGLSLAMLRVVIWYPAIVIGVITASLTTAGMLMGSRIGNRFGNRIEIIGGLILIGIGLKILLDHGIFT